MKLSNFLILSLFAFVSCENLPSQDVYEFSHIGEIQDPIVKQLKVRVDAKLKITISDIDDCVYFIYECQRPMHDFANPESLSGEEYSDAELTYYNDITSTPDKFLFIMEDREGNNLEQFYMDSKNPHVSSIKKDDARYPVIYKGKLAKDYLGELMTAKIMRSKLNRTEKGVLKIGYYSKSKLAIMYD